jgi:hypothetical protein
MGKTDKPEWLRLRSLIKERSLSAFQAAERLLAACDLKKSPVDMHVIARHLEVRLIIQDEGQHQHALNLTDWGRPRAKDEWDRNTFLCSAETHPMDHRAGWAHQLGHLLFHPYPKGLVRTCTEFDRGTEEVLANRFVQHLLMPLDRFRAEWKHTKDIAKLADLFDVRQALVQRRVELVYKLHIN